MRKTILKVLFAMLAFSLVMFVACKNEPVASGAGSITCTLNGVVYDSLANMPVEGAQVDIGTQAVKTDENGCFALENVAPGSYTISIVKEGYEMERIEDVLVDSGRFYNNLSENDKAALTELITNGAEIDDYYVELLFGGERDADGGNPDIDSVGDAKYYGQTVVAVGLTPSDAVLEGAINVKFQDKSTYDVPDGVGVIAFLVGPGAEVEPEILRTYRTTVGENGSFRFENIQNGVYYLAVDPMSITLNESTVELDGYLFMEEGEEEEEDHPYEALVINGYGTTNTLFYDIQDVEVDPFKLRILSVKAIDRSELPLSSVSRDVVPTVSMEAGQAIVIEFNKHIDEDAFGTIFHLESEQTQLTGYTKHLIVNGGDGHGYAYVWHDSINSSSILELWYNVSSFEKDDSLEGCIYLGYYYQLNLKETNLYGYDYDHKLEDGVFKADQPIEIVFDREIPKGSTVEGVLTKKYQGDLPEDIPVIFEYDDNVLRAYAALEYRTDFGENIEDDYYYTLKFKITTSEDVVVYNTERGLYKPISGNMILSDDNNSIKFTTAKVSIIDATYGFINPYDGFFAEFNLGLEGNSAIAYLTSGLGEYSYIPLNCEIDDCIITATLDEDEALNPKFTYTLHLSVYSERYDKLFTLESEPFHVTDNFDDLFQNGLEDFTIDGDDYDWDSEVVSFSWTSLGEFLGQGNVYDLYKRMIDDEGEEIGDWEPVASFPEIEYFKYTYRDKEIEVACDHALVAGDLLYGKCAQFILVTYDEDGLMIQSPVQVVYDMLGPMVDSEDPYIEPETPYTELQHKVFTLVTDEKIATVREEDVEVGGAHPEYFDVTWVMTGDNSVEFTVKAKNAPISGYYEEGDLKLTINLRDTSYNQTEKVIDFKD